MILLIDNYDSFTYNLAQYLGQLGEKLEVHRNDQITIADIAAKKPDRIVISPGPGTPEKAGIIVEVIRQFGGKVPLLGVCLGHQAIGYAFGGRVIRAPEIMHGKTSRIHHDAKTIFRELPQDFVATRYHSLIVERKSLPEGWKFPPKPMASSWACATPSCASKACSSTPNRSSPKLACKCSAISSRCRTGNRSEK